MKPAATWHDSAPQQAVLLMSAGVDSLACLLHLRSYWDRLTVVWSNPGAPHPDTAAYMAKLQERVPHFVELRGNQPAWIRANGWPADVVPIRATVAGELGAGPGPIRFASYMDCCGANMWQPLRDFIASGNARMIVTGQRGDESLRNRLRDAEWSHLDGLTYWNPLHDWSRRDVLAFLEFLGEPLPPFYDDGATSSADCWNCTAFLDHNAGRLRHMRDAEPDRFDVVHTVLTELERRVSMGTSPLVELVRRGVA